MLDTQILMQTSFSPYTGLTFLACKDQWTDTTHKWKPADLLVMLRSSTVMLFAKPFRVQSVVERLLRRKYVIVFDSIGMNVLHSAAGRTLWLLEWTSPQLSTCHVQLAMIYKMTNGIQHRSMSTSNLGRHWKQLQMQVQQWAHGAHQRNTLAAVLAAVHRVAQQAQHRRGAAECGVAQWGQVGAMLEGSAGNG